MQCSLALDLASVQKVIVDVCMVDGEHEGFIEVVSQSHKMRMTSTALGLHLPLIAPVRGQNMLHETHALNEARSCRMRFALLGNVNYIGLGQLFCERKRTAERLLCHKLDIIPASLPIPLLESVHALPSEVPTPVVSCDGDTDPTLKIMIVTKENVAAYAFAKHFLRLGLPDSINTLVGRLVGYVELQKGPATLMSPRHFVTMSCAASRSSLDAVVVSTKNALSRIVLWQSGLRMQI